jgi:hypothetical protein
MSRARKPAAPEGFELRAPGFLPGSEAQVFRRLGSHGFHAAQVGSALGTAEVDAMGDVSFVVPAGGGRYWIVGESFAGAPRSVAVAAPPPPADPLSVPAPPERLSAEEIRARLARTRPAQVDASKVVRGPRGSREARPSSRTGGA